MIGAMETHSPYNQGSFLARWWSTRTFVQKRLIRFSLSVLVMAVCFPLYDLGLFGSVEGPLNPGKLGESLAGMGVRRSHAHIFFLSLLIAAVTWNWIYNLASHWVGARLTCNRTDEEGKVCGARAERRKVEHKKTGRAVAQYVCAEGHKRPEAHFHPVRKGTIGHMFWVIALTFCLIVFFFS